MSFLSPLFFLGLAAIAVPVLVHLIQRERKHVIEFPSLMFVQRIPYQSVRRRRIRHWALLLLRAAAIALIVAAFTRPFLPGGAAAALAAAGGSRELVILLDRSASMGYGDRWEQARAAAGRALDSLGAADRATLVLFSRNAEENIRATSDGGRIRAALDAATVTSEATRYGPALKLADSILARSTLQRREAILISDFQKSGWSGAEDVRFAEGMQLTPVAIASGETRNVAVRSVNFARAPFSNQERVTATAGIANYSATPASNVPVVLELDGRELETQRVSIGAHAAASVAFAPFTLAAPGMRGVVRVAPDSLAADNAFHFVLTPSQAVSVLVIDGGGRADASFYLSRALAVGTAPAFEVETVPAGRVSPAMLDGRSVVVLNNTVVPPGIAGGVLKRYVERGGGLLIVFGDRSSWPAGEAELLPGKLGSVVDRTSGRGGTLVPDYSHQVFEVFKAPRSGDFSAPRVLRYRAIETAAPDRVLARYDDGAVASAERRIGNGLVIVWNTTLDRSWNDFARTPIYLPLVHQLTKYLARYEPGTAWRTVGDVVDLSAALHGRAERVVVTPSNERRTIPAAEQGIIELNEQGLYEIRSAANPAGEAGDTARIAVNLDPAESDLTTLDPPELVAAVTGRATQAAGPAPPPAEITPEDAERQQALWWYLLLAGMLALAAETAIGNHLSRKERFL
jgi:hypothetical protein